MLFNIFKICRPVIPDFKNIYSWEGNLYVNLTINYIMKAFIKNWIICTMFRNDILVLVQKIRSMHNIELFTAWIGLFIICIYPAIDVRESNFRSTELVISFSHNLELWALKSPVTTDQIGNSSFVSLRSVSKFAQKFWNSSLFWLESEKYRLKDILHFLWALA